ncbi:RluA family pseudouridine synthase [Patescibacteria group bacterium]
MIVSKADNGKRLDKFLVENYKDFSRSVLQKLIKEGEVLVNMKKASAHYKIKEDDDINVNLPDLDFKFPEPEDIKLEVVFENNDILVVNKPSGMVVHPTNEGKHFTGTLVNALLNNPGKENLSNVGGDLRPGIVHRLDKDTSGLLIIAKNNKIHRYLIKKMKERTIEKTYYALILGEPETEEGTIDAPLTRARRDYKRITLSTEGEGREAITKYKVKNVFEYEGKRFSLIEANILTGRTHQIRVHFSSIGHPVIGDEIYGNKKVNSLFKLDRFFLHAAQLKFEMPDGTEIKIKKDLPKELKKVIHNLK